MKKKAFKIGLLMIGILILISIVLGFILGFLESFRIIFGSVYVLFLPGFILTYLFFPNNLNENEKIDWIERIALSFALSIAIVPLITFYLNLIGIKINLLNSFLTILAIIVISLLSIKYKENIKNIFKRKK